MKRSKWLVASLAATLLLACSSQKEPAEQAVANIDSSLASIHDGAAKYAPDTLQSVEAKVAGLKQKLASGDYKGVLADAPAVNSAVDGLRQEEESKQTAADAALAQTKQQWRTLNEEVPKMVADVHARIDALSKERHLPHGVTKASLASAKQDASSLDSMWTDATNAVSNEDYAGGVSKGQAVKDKATELMHSLGMKSS